jgi:ankyrin repeat protein
MSDPGADAAEALARACYDGDLDLVRELVEAGADVDAMGRNWNPLHAAIENLREDVARYLLAAGADPEFECCGFRPIHHAIDVEIDVATQANAPDAPDPTFTEMLLAAGADMDAPDDRGRTPLRMATERGHVRAVKLLRDRGASRHFSPSGP